jgi:hypothetical protein
MPMTFKGHFIGLFFFCFYVLYYHFHFILIFVFLFYFSGYLKGHGLKYHNVLFPNGMVAGVFGASASHNDIGVLNLSRLQDYLEDVLVPDHIMAGGYCLHSMQMQFFNTI